MDWRRLRHVVSRIVVVTGFTLAMMVGFGHVLLSSFKGNWEDGPIRRSAMMIAEVPETAKMLIKGGDPRYAQLADRLGNKSGWHHDNLQTGDGYLLMSRYSGDEDRHVVELIDLDDFSTKFIWRPDADVLPPEEELTRVRQWGPFPRWVRTYFEAVHPLLMSNGDLVIKDHGSPLMRIDACGNLVWRQATDMFKHSLNRDADGHLWVPSVIEPHDPTYGAHFSDDAITEVSAADGTILLQRSVATILDKAGYFPLLFGAGASHDDPTHMNDIEPVLADGPYWKKGDLFLSIRHQSMLALYRPSTDAILWTKQGPWMAQHDVDIIDDHTIAVFSNNAYELGRGIYIRGSNDVIFYDFATGETRAPYREVLDKLKVRTRSEGLFDLTETGRMIVEEENTGRLLIFSANGTLNSEYVNRASDGHVYTMGWSRYIPRNEGDAAVAALKVASLRCNAQL